MDLKQPYQHSFARLRVREWRQHRALTQLELADLAGVRRETIIRLEKGGPTARPGTQRKLAAALGTEPHELLSMPPGMAEQGDE